MRIQNWAINWAAKLVFLSFSFSCASHTNTSTIKPISNLKKTVILISIDGYRADYIERGLSPTLQRWAELGLRAKAVEPIYPSLTFPNHYAIVTGKYADDHGIVSNTMIDPAIPEKFTLSNSAAQKDTRWWNDAEPIWVTLSKNHFKTATMFWPGSEAEIRGHRPTYYVPYVHTLPGETRISKVLEWIDLPTEDRPQFISLYFSDVDSMGHEFGPDSPELNLALKQTDDHLKLLENGLKERGIFDQVHILVVSDHGMAKVNPEKHLVLTDFIESSEFDITSQGTILGIYPLKNNESSLLQKLKTRSEAMTCYPKKQIPQRLHYSKHRRIPPIVCDVKIGYYVGATKRSPSPGAHGYDPKNSEMAALFIGKGPKLSKGVIDRLSILDTHPLIQELLEVNKKLNSDGSLKKLRKFIK